MNPESLSFLLPSFKNHAIDILNVIYVHFKQKLLDLMQNSTKMKVKKKNAHMKSYSQKQRFLI